MKINIGLLTLVLLTIISCNNNNSYYTNQLDSTNLILSNAIADYNVVDSTEMANIRKSIKKQSKQYSAVGDSILIETLIPYSHIDKSLKQILKTDFRIRTEIENSKTQISNLIYDAKNNLIDTTFLVEYIKEEKKAVENIVNAMNYVNIRAKIELQRYDSLNLIIENYKAQNE